jgi:AAA ATPase domain
MPSRGRHPSRTYRSALASPPARSWSVKRPVRETSRSWQWAVGSTPNLAARLQGLAAADQIVIAALTRRLAGNAFELTDLGEHDLKGIAEPVHAWRVERALVTESRFDAYRGGSALTPLVGRDEELGLLLRRWSQAKDGEGQVALLSGEPGIGKSRILSAPRRRLEAQGCKPCASSARPIM